MKPCWSPQTLMLSTLAYTRKHVNPKKIFILTHKAPKRNARLVHLLTSSSSSRGRMGDLYETPIGLPVGDEARVDVAIFSLVALLYDSHFTNGPPQSGQEQT